MVVGAVIFGAGALTGLAPDAVSLVQILIQFGLGLWGNDLRRAALTRQGYVERTVVAGRNQTEAEHRYYTTVTPGAA